MMTSFMLKLCFVHIKKASASMKQKAVYARSVKWLRSMIWGKLISAWRPAANKAYFSKLFSSRHDLYNRVGKPDRISHVQLPAFYGLFLSVFAEDGPSSIS